MKTREQLLEQKIGKQSELIEHFNDHYNHKGFRFEEDEENWFNGWYIKKSKIESSIADLDKQIEEAEPVPVSANVKDFEIDIQQLLIKEEYNSEFIQGTINKFRALCGLQSQSKPESMKSAKEVLEAHRNWELGMSDYDAIEAMEEYASQFRSQPQEQSKEITPLTDEEIMTYFNNNATEVVNNGYVSVRCMKRSDVLEMAKWMRDKLTVK